MLLIERDHLLRIFRERLDGAKHVDIAVAWARPCDALEALVESAANGVTIRIAVGVSGNVTDPTTLRRLMDSANLHLRIAPSTLPHRIFHPKYFSFRGSDRIFFWIGSANLTRGGFGENDELVYEFEDRTENISYWFENLWNRLKQDPGPEIDDYANRYRPPPRRDPRPIHGDIPKRTQIDENLEWSGFVQRLRGLDYYWYMQSGSDRNVLGDTHSWIHTITVGREVIRLQDWERLTLRECYVLYGRDQKEGIWGFLGSLVATGRVTHLFNPDNMPGVGSVRVQLRSYVQNVLDADAKNIANVAHDAVNEIRRNISGFGAAAATRLLTLARPDCLVSVNKGSAQELGMLSRLPRTPDGLARNYKELLNWVYRQSWFNAPMPDDPLERMIWNNRAALLDAFVYQMKDD